MKIISMFLAAILKYGGIIGLLYLTLLIMQTLNFGWGGNKNKVIAVVGIIIAITMIFIGNSWSKKLLAK